LLNRRLQKTRMPQEWPHAERRLTDARNDGRVAPASFDTDRAALNSFYGWASSRYGIINPVPSSPRRGWRRADATGPDVRELPARDGLRPASASRRQVKWMLRPAFEQWVGIGLRGYGFDGLRRSGWRGGGCEDRDVAFTDGGEDGAGAYAAVVPVHADGEFGLYPFEGTSTSRRPAQAGSTRSSAGSDT
jgi:hypothetical protein